MTEPQKDTQRALAAAKSIIDGRDPNADSSKILVTLEALVSLVLLATMDNDTRKAAGMLNEGLVPGVEARLALASSRRV
jgi:hypothetical protein